MLDSYAPACFALASELRDGILCQIVFAQSSRPVAIDEAQMIKRRAIRSQSVGDDGLGPDVLILQQPPHESKGGCRVAPLLLDHVHHLPFVIDCTPDPCALTSDRRDHLVEVPAW